MTNTIVRGLVSSNISWWKHAEQKELNQPLVGSIRVKICSVKLNQLWYTCNYSKDTEYKQVIPSLEINYLLSNNNFNNLTKGNKVELVVDQASLYQNPGYSVEIKEEVKFLFIKCQANDVSIPVINLIEDISIKTIKSPKKVISSEELISLLLPEEKSTESVSSENYLLSLV